MLKFEVSATNVILGERNEVDYLFCLKIIFRSVNFLTIFSG